MHNIVKFFLGEPQVYMHVILLHAFCNSYLTSWGKLAHVFEPKNHLVYPKLLSRSHDAKCSNLHMILHGLKYAAKHSIGSAIVLPMPSAASKEPHGRKRLSEEQETAKLIRKKTRVLGEDSESEDSSEDVVARLDRVCPGWQRYEETQHEAHCLCDFCKIYFGRVSDTPATETTPTNERQGSTSTTFETVPEPPSPDAA